MQKSQLSSFDRFVRSAALGSANSVTMKFLALTLCTIVVVHCAKADESVISVSKPIAILKQDSAVNPDGSHYNVWESENGIRVQEEGVVKHHSEDGRPVQSVSGQFSYNDANGEPISLTYVADENGYKPQGSHLPTSPPVPEAIVRALEYIAAHPSRSKRADIAFKSVFRLSENVF